MPELAEVEYYKRQWEPAIGQVVQKLDLHGENRVFRDTNTEDLVAKLPKRQFREALAHGKQMLFRFDDDGWLGFHLGMAGKLFRKNPDSYEAHKHDHLVIHLCKDVLIFRDTRYFGRVLWSTGPKAPHWWRSTGPNLISEDYTLEMMADSFQKRKKSPVKSVLLDQEHFPGIGNWMADEILWRAAVHPQKLAGQLNSKELRMTFNALKQVCEDALRVIAPDWSNPPTTWLFRHRWKDGGKCPLTGKPLARIQVGGRTTCFSPARQGEHS